MELLIFCKCNPPRLRGGGGWSCPDEEVLNSIHATPQARRFGTADTNSNKSLFTHFCNLCCSRIKSAASGAGNETETVLLCLSDWKKKISAIAGKTFTVRPQTSTCLLAYLPSRNDPNMCAHTQTCLQIPSGRVNGHAPALTCGFISIFSFCFRCTRPCRFLSSLRANLFPQTSHEKGFSPV